MLGLKEWRRKEYIRCLVWRNFRAVFHKNDFDAYPEIRYQLPLLLQGVLLLIKLNNVGLIYAPHQSNCFQASSRLVRSHSV